MRILYLHPRSWNGEYFMLRQLRAMGYEVCALEEKRDLERGPRRLADHYREAGDGISTYWYDPRRGGEKLLTWPFDRIFRRNFEGRNLIHRMWVIHHAVRLFRPDVLVCSDGFTYAIPAALLKRLRLLKEPLLVGYIGGDILDCPEAEYGHPRTGLTDWLIKASFPGINLFRPVSPMLRDVLLGDGARAAAIKVCPTHLVSDRRTLERVLLDRKAITRRVRAQYGLASSAPVIVTLSGNQKGKGMHVLARAWSAMIAAHPGARWLLCGPVHPWIEQAVWPVLDEHRIRNTVVTTGQLDGISVFEHLAAADLNVNPTLCEGLNMVVVEAAAVGTPTISTDGAGIADWVTRHEAGVIVPVGDPQTLAEAMIRALGSRDIIARWAVGAISMARDFSLENVAEQLSDLILTLAVPLDDSSPN
jgi:glycosyltransferase involved in cell wall biosynthesis